tara:strand:+ start:2393 stop:6508 length:4116 start_codon:yes stop_codon:yes gene_type:complete
MSELNKAVNTDGIDRKDRLLPALQEGYFNVDEMSFEDLVEISVDFASHLTYYNKDLKAVGNWSSFLASNEIVIMALIINKDFEKLGNEFRNHLKDSEALSLKTIFKLIVEVNAWLEDLRRSNSVPAQELTAAFERIILNGLLENLHNLGMITTSSHEAREDYPFIDFRKLDKVWGIFVEDETAIFPKSTINLSDETLNRQSIVMNAGFGFLNAIEHLKTFCKELLPYSLKTQNHDPAVGLYISFISLYKHAQDNINGFTQRHLDFYYRDILKTQYQHKNPESVILNFEISSQAKPLTIGKGAKFTCMKDEESKDVIFEAPGCIKVTDAKIEEIHTLRYQREDMITPACDMNFITRIYKQSISGLSEEATDLEQEGLPIFGHGGQAKKQSLNNEIETGLAIASKDLFLEEGERRIEIDLLLTRLIRPIPYHIQNLGSAASSTEFKEILCELMISWLNEGERYNWNDELFSDDFKELEEIALGLDLQSLSITEEDIDDDNKLRLSSCKSMLAQVTEFLSITSMPNSSSLPFYSYILIADSGKKFRKRLGLFMIHALIEKGSVSEIFNGDLDNKAIQLGVENSLETVKRELKLGRDNLFKNYFGNAFNVGLSTEDGWFTLDRFDITERSDNRLGLRVALIVSSDAPAIIGCLPDIHGEGWGTKLPLLKLRINRQASTNPYSLLENFSIENLELTVGVSGLRNIRAYNNISQLDPSKPFYPFGPTPTTNAYLAITSPELVKKNVKKLWINLNWGELPNDEEGFSGHYKGYVSEFKNNSFTAKLNVLSNGSWQPQSMRHSQTAPLFNYQGKKLSESQLIEVQAVDLLKPMGIDAAENELDLGLKTRNGFIKLTLDSPEGAFGHQEYPLRLTEIIEANSKFFVRKKQALPKSPYTPLLNQISFDYIASSEVSMQPKNNNEPSETSDKLYRLHEFGAEKLTPNSTGKPINLFRPVDFDGHLFLGISASELKDLLTLSFSLSDDSERINSGETIELQWTYLSSSGWAELSKNRIVSDETKGFLRSGIIIIDIPEDISNQHKSMPGNLYWLKISTSADSSNFCSLRNVKTHALKLKRSLDDNANFEPSSHLPSEMNWRALATIPGLSKISQIDGFLGNKLENKRSELITRVSERIRHRSRAIVAWDYERLILEKFPIVGKVKCLPNCTQFSLKTLPGNLLIVVTPKISEAFHVYGKAPKLSATHLNDIHEYVSSLSSSFGNIEVINPVSEWVQVRCKAMFQKYARNGKYVEQLNQDIRSYLNPWDKIGYRLIYGQKIKQEDVYSYIYNLEYIKYVTEFSMLHITRDSSGFYRLGDSVRQGETKSEIVNISPLYPWSLIMPISRHNIEVVTEVDPREPDITGIRELEIGSTFIINGNIVDG